MLRCTILDAQGLSQSLRLDLRSDSRRIRQERVRSVYKVRLVRRTPSQCKLSSYDPICLSDPSSIQPRDLRKIDSRIPNLVPTILTRKEAILVNILHIRALVKADAVILFDSYGSVDSRLHSVFLYHLEHNLKQKSTTLPYEFRALESILVSVVSALEAEMVFTRHLVAGLLAELEDDIDRDKFKRLLHYSRRLQSFTNRAKLVQTALEEVLQQGRSVTYYDDHDFNHPIFNFLSVTHIDRAKLDSDEDMNHMYLTDKKLGVERKMEDHDELEVLLESFDKQVEEIVNEAETTIVSLCATFDPISPRVFLAYIPFHSPIYWLELLSY
ncbi:unnamed protein product [Rhizoctonia solani]|nr:unnamed protein product [Rhizoctonia solani]